jgi:hypothetical protein
MSTNSEALSYIRRLLQRRRVCVKIQICDEFGKFLVVDPNYKLWTHKFESKQTRD